MDTVTSLLCSPDDAIQADQLLPLVYTELRKLAVAQMSKLTPGQTLQPTALVHEAWLRLTRGKGQQFPNRAYFFVAATEAMRRILVESARRKSRLKRGAGQRPVDISELELAETTPDEKILL